MDSNLSDPPQTSPQAQFKPKANTLGTTCAQKSILLGCMIHVQNYMFNL